MNATLDVRDQAYRADAPKSNWQEIQKGTALQDIYPLVSRKEYVVFQQAQQGYSVFSDVWARKIYRGSESWERFLHRIETTDGYSDKSKLPLLSFASFGDKPTKLGSLRNDENVIAINGVLCDYDGEVMPIEDASNLLGEAGVACALYPSASYTALKPRWRIVVPFRSAVSGTPKELKVVHKRMVSRINGVIGGVLASESWNMSQAYYFGKADTAERYDIIRVVGRYLDQLSGLKEVSCRGISSPSDETPVKSCSQDAFANKVALLGRRLQKGDERRAMLMSYIGSEVICGTSAESIKLQVLGIAAKYFEKDGDYDEENINRIVGDFVVNADQEWEEPVPLPSDLPPVQVFDMSLLPEALRPWIVDIAERMQISPDIPAVGAITALSSAIGRRIRIKPKKYDDWEVVPNLWGAVVAPPGFAKSPALSAVMVPLDRLERQAQNEYRQALEQYEVDKDRAALANSAAKTVAREALKKNPLAQIAPVAVGPEPPKQTRYIMHDFSVEAVGEVLINNPNGVLTFNDELFGLLMMADKPGNEQLHAFLLQAWNGNGGFSFDRIGRGHRFVDYVCLSLLGGIQPGRLMKYLESSANGGAADSGFIQRFQLLTWPDLSEDWKLVDREPDHRAAARACEVFERVVSGMYDDVRHFDPEAQEAFLVWLTANERECRSESGPEVMRSHLSKYKSMVPSLALIFAVADGAEGDIPVQYVRQAIGWAAYLQSHAERVYYCTTNSEPRRARTLLTKIKEGKVSSEFKAADVYLKGWSDLNTPHSVEKTTDLLCDLGYLKRFERKSGDVIGRGRTAVTFRVNPKVIGAR